ncbi:MAG: cobalamin B12-binding domain-containing protein [Planctomycetes bacterium]|nr:cobalamin B12-binding domain-containing protein [Planctomycetota bacterium]
MTDQKIEDRSQESGNRRRIKVLIAKPGLDGHDKGAKVVCQLLRNSGMEVIYSGLHASVSYIVKAAVEEDVDVVGLSIHSGVHKEVCEKIILKLKEAGYDGFVVLGGVVPKSDENELKKLGIKAVFRLDTPHEEIVNTIKNIVMEKVG